MKWNRTSWGHGAVAVLLLGGLLSEVRGQTWLNWIRQIQTEENGQIARDLYVGIEGTEVAQDPVPEGGALFELWTLRDDPFGEWLLDQSTVGAYLPRASVTVVTEDPYPNANRTRADRPFTVRVEMEGLIEDPDVQQAAREVLFQQFAQSYPEGSFSLPGGEVTNDVHFETYLSDNGEHELEFTITALDGGNPLKVAGEEHFFIQALEDYGVDPVVIARDEIQIWPVADGSIEGVEDGDRVGISPRDLTMTVNDAYPGSVIYCHAYEGAPNLGTEGILVPGSHKNVTATFATDHEFILSDWTGVFPEDGYYTLELLTETPFGTERLDFVSFYVDATLNVRGSLQGLEN
ncbi:MAG: hypothetical protein AAGC74_11675 [Verrucomicrobiota bacterium]